MTETFSLRFDTDNDSFTDDNLRTEIARILREIAREIETGGEIRWYQTIFDANGNDIGRYAHKPHTDL